MRKRKPIDRCDSLFACTLRWNAGVAATARAKAFTHVASFLFISVANFVRNPCAAGFCFWEGLAKEGFPRALWKHTLKREERKATKRNVKKGGLGTDSGKEGRPMSGRCSSTDAFYESDPPAVLIRQSN